MWRFQIWPLLYSNPYQKKRRNQDESNHAWGFLHPHVESVISVASQLLTFLPFALSLMMISSDACGFTFSSSSSSGNCGGFPYSSISLFNLSAQAWWIKDGCMNSRKQWRSLACKVFEERDEWLNIDEAEVIDKEEEEKDFVTPCL